MLSLGSLNGIVFPDIQMEGRQASAVDGCQKFLEVSILTVFKEEERWKVNYKNTQSLYSLSPLLIFLPFPPFPFLLTMGRRWLWIIQVDTKI